MKKRIITAIMVITLSLSAISFSSVKAATEVNTLQTNSRIEYNGNLIGYYLTYSANVNPSSDYLDLSIYGVVNTDDYFKTATFIEIRFSTYCNGYIYVNYSGNMNPYTYNVPVGDGVGRYTYSATNKRMAIYFENCNHIVVYNFSPTYQATPTAQVSSITVNQYSVADSSSSGSTSSMFHIPIESYTAYSFAVYKIDQLNYSISDIYPYIDITTGDPYTGVSDYVYLDPFNNFSNNDTHFVFLSNSILTTSDFTNTLSQNVILILERIYDTYGGYYMYDIIFRNSGSGQANAQLSWNKSFQIIPIYFGKKYRCPANLYEMIWGNMYYMIENIDHTTQSMLSYLEEIYDMLMEYEPVDESFQDTTDIIQDLTDQEDQVIGDFKNDIDDFNNNIDLDDYDFLQDIAGPSEYFKMMLGETFNKSVQVRAFWVIPVICVVIIKLLGQ